VNFRRLAYAVSRLVTLLFRRRYRVPVGQIPLVRVDVPVTGLPPHLKDFTIGVMSDLHLGALVDPEYIRAAAERLAAERPDLIVVAGDFVSEAAAVPLLAEVLAPVRDAWGVLCHEPDFADRVAERHRVAVQISGHSHGGQVRLPFIGPPLLPPLGRRYVAGLYRAPFCQVYTSRGLGVAHLPLRFLCPPEISVLRMAEGMECPASPEGR